MNETGKERKEKAAENYRKAELDSLQAQLNAQRTRTEVLEKRVTRQTNRLAIHLNNEEGDNDV